MPSDFSLNKKIFLCLKNRESGRMMFKLLKGVIIEANTELEGGKSDRLISLLKSQQEEINYINKTSGLLKRN